MVVGRVRTGVILISIGVLLLLNTTGVVDFGFWYWIGKLWPVILIAIGLEKIFASASSSSVRNLAWLSPLLIVAVVSYAVMAGVPPSNSHFGDWNWNWDFSDNSPSGSMSTWNESFTGTADKLDVTFRLDAGRITVRDGAEAGNVLTARANSRGEKPRVETSISDGVQRIKITQKDGYSGRSRDQWIMKLSDSIPVDLSVDGGAARIRLDLTSVKAQSLDLQAGAADIDIFFGALVPDVTCKIDCGAASLNVTIPANAGIRVKQTGAMQHFSEGDIEMVEHGGYNESRDYESAPVKIDLTLDAALSSMRLRRATGPASEST